jgi:HrpA-like RNA helicase
MNFQAKGLPIARLKTKFKKGEDIILCNDEKSVGKPNFPDEIDLRKFTGGSSSSFQIIPSHAERDVLYVCGKSGSGKSYHIKNYCLEFTRNILKIRIG